MKVWWWLSFASKEANLGIALVEATNFVAAVRCAHQLGINPGGEVAGWPIVGLSVPAPRWRHRLLDRAEANEMSVDWTGVGLVSTKSLEDERLALTIDPEVVPSNENEGS